MTTPTQPRGASANTPIIACDIPVMYEDDGQEEMGESMSHTLAERILCTALGAHFRSAGRHAVLCNLDFHYHPVDRRAYVSPDVGVVLPYQPLPNDLESYRIGEQGPAPVVVIEILSQRSYQQQDLTSKVDIYSAIGVNEYILVDSSGRFLPERLQLRRLQSDGTCEELQDPDGGVTSRLGFRIVLEEDGQPRVLNARTGERYLRPEEAQNAQRAAQAAEEARAAEAEARRQAEERLRALEEELARLRRQTGEGPGA